MSEFAKFMGRKYSDELKETIEKEEMVKIAFVGKMHSGKTTALNTIWKLAESIDKWPMITKFAKPLYDTQEIFVGKNTKKNRLFLQTLSSLSKESFGEEILSELFKKRIKELEENFPENRMVLLCDDIRVHSDFNTAKECGFIIIGIDASDEIRKARNPELFVGTDHITETQVKYLIKHADIIVDGNLLIDQFEYKIAEIWCEISIKRWAKELSQVAPCKL